MYGGIYAAVASAGDDGIQIVDVTNPASPVPAGNLPDAGSLLLDGVRSVDVFMIGQNAYAAAASAGDDGIQIVNITARPDVQSPSFASASLNTETGEMTITFDEKIHASAADLSKMHVSEAGQTNEVALTGADFDSAVPNSTAISMTLIQSQLSRITLMATPQLDIEAGAVSEPLQETP